MMEHNKAIQCNTCSMGTEVLTLLISVPNGGTMPSEWEKVSMTSFNCDSDPGNSENEAGT